MNELAVQQIDLAISMRRRLEYVNAEIARLRPPKKPRTLAKKMVDAGVPVTFGPLLANGTFYARGVDKYTHREYDCCPTCGQRLRVTLDTRNGR